MATAETELKRAHRRGEDPGRLHRPWPLLPAPKSPKKVLAVLQAGIEADRRKDAALVDAATILTAAHLSPQLAESLLRPISPLRRSRTRRLRSRCISSLAGFSRNVATPKVLTRNMLSRLPSSQTTHLLIKRYKNREAEKRYQYEQPISKELLRTYDSSSPPIYCVFCPCRCCDACHRADLLHDGGRSRPEEQSEGFPGPGRCRQGTGCSAAVTRCMLLLERLRLDNALEDRRAHDHHAREGDDEADCAPDVELVELLLEPWPQMTGLLRQGCPAVRRTSISSRPSASMRSSRPCNAA